MSSLICINSTEHRVTRYEINDDHSIRASHNQDLQVAVDNGLISALQARSFLAAVSKTAKDVS